MKTSGFNKFYSTCPCKDCPRKGCGTYHDQCEQYQEYQRFRAEVNKKKADFNDSESYHIQQITKSKKKSKWRTKK